MEDLRKIDVEVAIRFLRRFKDSFEVQTSIGERRFFIVHKNNLICEIKSTCLKDLPESTIKLLRGKKIK